MAFSHPHPRAVLLRLMIVAALAVSHCCLLGHSVWAAGLHGDAAVHGTAGHVASTDWTRCPGAPMVCGGAHGVATARTALPDPAPAAVPVVAEAVPLAGAQWVAPAYRDPPDPLPPSRATLQIFRI